MPVNRKSITMVHFYTQATIDGFMVIVVVVVLKVREAAGLVL